MPLELKNPHSILAALQTRPPDVLQIQMPGGRLSRGWSDIGALAQRHSIRLTQAPRQSPAKRKQPGRQGGGTASVKPRAPLSLAELLPSEPLKHDDIQLWLGLDCIQDPHNVGAIFRTAAFFGVSGIVVTQDRSAPLTATVYDIASGGLEYVPFAVETNLARALSQAKEKGLWILGSSEHAEVDIHRVSADRPWMLLLGNEEKGLRRLTLDNCDTVCKLTARTAVDSLNVSVAAGALISRLTQPPANV